MKHIEPQLISVTMISTGPPLPERPDIMAVRETKMEEMDADQISPSGSNTFDVHCQVKWEIVGSAPPLPARPELPRVSDVCGEHDSGYPDTDNERQGNNDQIKIFSFICGKYRKKVVIFTLITILVVSFSGIMWTLLPERGKDVVIILSKLGDSCIVQNA